MFIYKQLKRAIQKQNMFTRDASTKLKDELY